MSEELKIDEILKKLQEPFDKNDGDEALGMNGKPIYRFSDSVYIKRLNDVVGSEWDSKKVSSGFEITINAYDKILTRVGENFVHACEMFGMGQIGDDK